MIIDLIKILGRRVVWDFFRQTQDIESKGGMMTNNGARRRTAGGVMMHLLRTTENQEISKKAKKLFKKSQKERRVLQAQMPSRRDVAEMEYQYQWYHHVAEMEYQYQYQWYCYRHVAEMQASASRHLRRPTKQRKNNSVSEAAVVSRSEIVPPSQNATTTIAQQLNDHVHFPPLPSKSQSQSPFPSRSQSHSQSQSPPDAKTSNIIHFKLKRLNPTFAQSANIPRIHSINSLQSD